MKRDGFTLIEMIVVIVILGIIMAVSVPKYIDMKKQASDATAQGVLAAIRSANSILFVERILKNSTATYTMEDISSGAHISGSAKHVVYGNTGLRLTVGEYSYVFTMDVVGQPPTTFPKIYSDNNW